MPQKIILQCGEQQIVLPVTFQYDSMDSGDREHNDSRAAQISSLFSFATDGDPLALLTPLAHLLSECDSDGCKSKATKSNCMPISNHPTVCSRPRDRAPFSVAIRRSLRASSPHACLELFFICK
uniref:Uncharacterized protein n=1 Tax=Ascaris lumbricoides TaxID=6252 RepID=A0A0M3IUG6_ASCLU